MIITEEVQKKMEDEFARWVENQYAGKSIEERQVAAQYYTPPAMTIRLIEEFDSVEDTDILDPSSGCGGLLAGCIIAGADPKRVYGVEIDPDIVKVSKERLSKMGVPEENIQLGNALNLASYEFDVPSQIANQQSYLSAIFCKSALNIVDVDGWREEYLGDILNLLRVAFKDDVSLKGVLDARYGIYDVLSSIPEEKTRTDLWKLFPKYDPLEDDRKKRLQQIEKKPESFLKKGCKPSVAMVELIAEQMKYWAEVEDVPKWDAEQR